MLRTLLVIFFLIALCSSSIYAQLEWGGNYENHLGLSRVKKELTIQDQNRLRLNIDASASEELFFKGSVVFDKWGSNELELALKENKDMYKLRRYKNDWK